MKIYIDRWIGACAQKIYVYKKYWWHLITTFQDKKENKRESDSPTEGSVGNSEVSFLKFKRIYRTVSYLYLYVSLELAALILNFAPLLRLLYFKIEPHRQFSDFYLYQYNQQKLAAKFYNYRSKGTTLLINKINLIPFIQT